ncbi:MAG: site-specific DNA-methyltransferase [Planctomycetaceae bacterium]|jgi:site-specific DNA-methyltransferase (cytosine-N4-specific)|nr:site-specific DNA-methyltransferase [Planctomycetaceae bacterium]
MSEAELSIRILQGDCRDLLPTLPTDSVDLVFTSPPYADSRKNTYGGVPPDEYVEWFLPIGTELLRVLKPSGTFILNLKENVVNGERSTYVIELILALRKLGWIGTEEFLWHKKNATPGKWPNRFRDAWERLLQFNKSRRFAMYQDAVKVPPAESAKRCPRYATERNQQQHMSATGSGLTRRTWIYKELVYPSNVLFLPTESGNKKHSAVFPEALPEWFVKLFTLPGDVVLDPFLGSGTTGVVCHRLNRHFIGMEILPQYVELARERIFFTKTSKRTSSDAPSLPLLPLFASQSNGA